MFFFNTPKEKNGEKIKDWGGGGGRGKNFLKK